MLSQLTRETLTLSVVLLFIAELVSFPLLVELIMLPSILFLTLLIAYCERQANNTPETVKVLFFLRCIQAITSFIILAVSYWLVVFNIKEFWSLHTLELLSFLDNSLKQALDGFYSRRQINMLKTLNT